MNPYLDAPPAPTPARPPLGAPPPALVALAVAVGAGALLVALGVAAWAALGLAAIGGSVTGLVAAALRIAHDWARDPGHRPGGLTRGARGDLRDVSTTGPEAVSEAVTEVAPAYRGPTMMTQDWRDATFVHWRVDPAEVAGMLPAGVRPDVHDGATFVGLVPFRMVGAGVARGPSIPWFGSFLETNVRLYTVDDTGRRGIVFRSLDADRAAVVVGAQASFGLPYRWARMAFDRAGGEITYRAVTRREGHRSVVRVRPGPPVATDPLLAFLTARWALHERHAGVTWSVPNVHEPWPLHAAALTHLDDGLVAAAGFPQLRGRAPDLVHHSPGVSVRFGFPRPYRAGR